MQMGADALTGGTYKDAGSVLKLLLLAAAGAAAYLLLRLIIPAHAHQSVLAPSGTPEGPILVRFLFRVRHLLFESFWLQLMYFAWFVFLSVAKRAQPMARVYAFIAGYALPYIIFHSSA
jgi:hypothetical protein